MYGGNRMLRPDDIRTTTFKKGLFGYKAAEVDSFKDTVFRAYNDLSKDYEETKKQVMEALKKELRPEFINRIDEIIVFHKLTDNEIDKIIDIMLKEVVQRLKDQKIEIELEPSVKKFIAGKGIDKNFGARPLRRTIQSVLEDRLAEEILDGNLKKNKVNKIGVKDDKVIVEKK